MIKCAISMALAIVLRPVAAAGAEVALVNAQRIEIPAAGPAEVYPSTIVAANLPGPLTGISVTLSNLTHTFPDDLEVVLLAPNGRAIQLLSDAGGSSAANGITVTFTPPARAVIPDLGPLASGVFQPAAYPPVEILPPPAPGSSYLSELSELLGESPNGTWRLFVFDDANNDEGFIQNGWRLHLTVPNVLPVIKASPASVVAAQGGLVTLSVVAAGTPTLTYQWWRNGAPIPGATSPTYNVLAASAVAGGNYSVTVANAFGTATSAVATVSVLVPPSFSEQPTDATVALGGNVVLSAGVSGATPIRYQWRLNGVNLPDKTNATLAVGRFQASQAGRYTLVALNAVGLRVSRAAIILPAVAILTPADQFANRQSLGNSGSGIVRTSNALASRETDEPVHAGRTSSRSVWFSWVAPSAGVVTFTTAGSTFDTLLAAYTGGTLATLTPVASDDDSGRHYTSSLQFSVQALQTYSIAVDGLVDQTGDIVLGWQLQPTNVFPPVLEALPLSQTQRTGSNVSFSVTATGHRLSFQWLHQGIDIPGATRPDLNLSSVQSRDVGPYAVRVTSPGGGAVVSRSANLEIGPAPDVQSQEKLRDLLFPGAIGFSLATTNQAPTYIPVASGLGTIGQILSVQNATSESGVAASCLTLSDRTRWLGLQPLTNGLLTLDTLGTTFKTTLAVYVGSDEFMTELACATSPTTGPDPLNFLALPVSANTKYNVYLDTTGPPSAGGLIWLNWTLGARLFASLQNGRLLLRWSAPPGEYLVERTTELRSPPQAIVWAELNPTEYPVVREGNRHQLTLTHTPPFSCFRLRRAH